MPTYDYACRACGHRFEHFQSISAEKLRDCPECGKPELERLIGAGAGIVFKGSGFYETDYRSESYKRGEKGEKAQSDDKKPADGRTSEGASEGTSRAKGKKTEKPNAE